MATGSQGDDQNDAISSHTQREETTATLTSPLPSLPSSSSNPLRVSRHAPPLPTLPFELVTEILYRLPVKFLLQLKCICKSWKSLISDPKFAKKHLQMSTTPHHLIVTYVNPSHDFLTAYPLSSIFTGMTAAPMHLEYPLNKRICFDHLVGSCDGILCFQIDQNFALLYNPSIRKFKKLPSMDNPHEMDSYTIYSFGYDRVTNDYKVVAIFGYECDNGVTGNKTLVKVYTLSTNRWRRIQEFPLSTNRFTKSGKFVSGTLNWLARANSSSSSLIIVSLDLGSECYKEILQPDYDRRATLKLGVLRHCLCIIYHSEDYFDVWIMKEYGNKDSWTKLFIVPNMGDIVYCTKVLYAYEDDRMLLECHVPFNHKFVAYDYDVGTSKTLEIQYTSSWKDYKVSEVYIESLVSPCF